jgi:hypothetical protein
MFRCESVAPFGKPVVPLVYWMLIGSSGVSSTSGRSPEPANSASQSGVPKNSAGTSGAASAAIAT